MSVIEGSFPAQTRAEAKVLATTSAGTAHASWARAAAWFWLLCATVMLALGSTARAQSNPPTIAVSGPQGGPFPSAPVTVQLSNPHAGAIQWYAVQDPEWLKFSRKKGQLQPGANSTLTAKVDQAKAAQLPVGDYEARVMYRHPVTQLRVTMVIFKLTVAPATYSLSVTPNQSFDAQGAVGGPFSPSSITYTLQNTGNTDFDWTATSDQPWVFAQLPSSGVLAPGASTPVQVLLDGPLTSALPGGVHNATITFVRSSTGAVVDSRAVHLTVNTPTSSGWTDFQPSVDTRVVYVSASGNDANDGLTQNTPKRTISAGKALMRNGYPDWLLLKRGDVFDSRIGQWVTSGRSNTERQLISSYGTSTQRPLLRTGTQDGISTLFSGSSPARIDHVAIVGLEFWAHTYTGTGNPSGVAWLIESDDTVIEDCLIRGYEIDVMFTDYGGRKSNIQVRRNVLVDAFSTTGTVGHGLYVSGCDTVLIEDNVIDHNGWNPSIPGATPSMFRHGVYIQSGGGTCTGVTLRGNIISNSASHGLHLRPGGVAEDNLFVQNSIALSLGGGNEPDPGGVNVIAKGNVILDGKDIDAANPRGWGIDLSNIASAQVSYNIVANQSAGHFPVPLSMGAGALGFGVHNAVVEHNIFSGWGGSAVISGASTQFSGVMLRYNDFNQNVSTDQIIDHLTSSSTSGFDSLQNRFYCLGNTNAWMLIGSSTASVATWGSIVGDSGSTTLPNNAYPDPTRSLARYHQSIGGAANNAAFLAQARLQSRANWRAEYTAAAAIAYVRAGFGLVVP